LLEVALLELREHRQERVVVRQVPRIRERHVARAAQLAARGVLVRVEDRVAHPARDAAREARHHGALLGRERQEPIRLVAGLERSEASPPTDEAQEHLLYEVQAESDERPEGHAAFFTRREGERNRTTCLTRGPISLDCAGRRKETVRACPTPPRS